MPEDEQPITQEMAETPREPSPTPTETPTAPEPEIQTSIPSESVPAIPVPTSNARTIALHRFDAHDRSAANATRLAKREHKLNLLMSYAQKHGKPLSNNEIQLVLGVTDVTATRYATLLVQRGVMKMMGTGKSARYQMVSS